MKKTTTYKGYDLEDAHFYSCNNKPGLENDELCGCFYCLKIYRPKEIQDYVVADNNIDRYGTALCPWCGIDSVIGKYSGYPITHDFLKAMRKRWFDE